MASNPTPEQILALRGKRSRAAVAALAHCSARTWEKWEQGRAKMHPGLFELVSLKSPKR